MKNIILTASIIMSAFSMQACDFFQSPELEGLAMIIGGSTTSTSTDGSTDGVTDVECYDCP